MVELRDVPSLPALLPDVLAALSSLFSEVDCEVVACPDFTQSPHYLPVKAFGEVHALPESNPIDADLLLPGAQPLAVTGAFRLIATDVHPSPGLKTLKISLQSSTEPGDWHSQLKAKLKKHVSPTSDFLVIEEAANKSRLHLVALGSAPQPLAVAAAASGAASATTLWLVPVARVHHFDVIPNGEEKKVVKKKIVKKVVKKKVPSSSGKEKTPPDTKDKDTKEKSPEVVQAVVEDVSSVSYLVRMGLEPAPDGVSLKDQPHASVWANGIGPATNGISTVTNGTPTVTNGTPTVTDKNSTISNGIPTVSNGTSTVTNVTPTVANDTSTVTNGISTVTNEVSTLTNGINKTSSSTTNAINGTPEAPKTNGTPETPTLNGTLSPEPLIGTLDTPRETSSRSWSSSSVATVIDGGASAETSNGTLSTKEPQEGTPPANGTVLKAAEKFDTTVTGTSPPRELSSRFSRTDSNEDEYMGFARPSQSPLRSSTLTNGFKDDPLLSPSVKSNGDAPQSLLNGFLSSVSRSFNFARGSSPSSPKLGSSLSTGSPLSPITSESNIPARINGIRHSDSTDWSLSLRSTNTSSSTLASARRVGSRGSPFSSILGLPTRLSSVGPDPLAAVRARAQIPVVALQESLKKLSYREISELRRVHPQWDEICGQMLNGAYYTLTAQADKLMLECQRRVYTEKHLEDALNTLTSIQVHILNTVDIMRAPMDEGVVCFPYGQLLDKTFALLNKLQRVVEGKDEPEAALLHWKPVAELARKAQAHYKRYVEPEVEKRMGEVNRLTAQARLQRIDSFLVESQVTKLERETEQSRNDLRWEIEQLKAQNLNLKRDNRDLKQAHSRLEARVEGLERKFKTVARLLQ